MEGRIPPRPPYNLSSGDIHLIFYKNASMFLLKIGEQIKNKASSIWTNFKEHGPLQCNLKKLAGLSWYMKTISRIMTYKKRQLLIKQE